MDSDRENQALSDIRRYETKNGHFLEEKTHLSDFKAQIMSVMLIGTSMTHAGLTLAFSNLLNNVFKDDVISTFASFSALCTPVGSVIVSILFDKFGRKYNLLLIQTSCIITWIMAILINDTSSLYLCAGLAGLSRGALTACCPAYISEITHSNYRQLFLSLNTAFFTLGIFLISLLHIFLTYKQSAIFLTLSFMVLSIFTVLLIPESPHWLAVIKLDLNKAKENLKKLNPSDREFNREWRLLETKMKTSNCSLTTMEKLKFLRKASAYKPCLILLGMIFFQQFCGIYPFTCYTLRSLPHFGELGELYKTHIFAVSGISRLIISILTSLALAKFNQKQLLLISAMGMLLSSLVLIFNVEIASNYIFQKSISEWINISSFMVYLMSGYIGLLGIPWTIIFELLPTEIKGLMGPIMVGIGYASMSLVLKYFPTVYDFVGTTYMFVYVIVICTSAIGYIKYFVVETKGKSLYEIEKFYSKKRTHAESESDSN